MRLRKYNMPLQEVDGLILLQRGEEASDSDGALCQKKNYGDVNSRVRNYCQIQTLRPVHRAQALKILTPPKSRRQRRRSNPSKRKRRRPLHLVSKPHATLYLPTMLTPVRLPASSSSSSSESDTKKKAVKPVKKAASKGAYCVYLSLRSKSLRGLSVPQHPHQALRMIRARTLQARTARIPVSNILRNVFVHAQCICRGREEG